MLKYKRRIVIILSVIIVLLFIGMGIAGNYFYYLALNPNTSKDKVFGKSDDS